MDKQLEPIEAQFQEAEKNYQEYRDKLEALTNRRDRGEITNTEYYTERGELRAKNSDVLQKSLDMERKRDSERNKLEREKEKIKEKYGKEYALYDILTFKTKEKTDSGKPVSEKEKSHQNNEKIRNYMSYLPQAMYSKVNDNKEIIMFLLLLPFIVYIIRVIYIKFFKKTDSNYFFREIDYVKMQKKIRDHISFFKAEEGKVGVPRTSKHHHYISYDAEQLCLWLRFVYNGLTNDDAIFIGKKNYVSNDSETIYTEVNHTDYVNYGRMIGNYGNKKFEEVWKVMKNGIIPGSMAQSVVYSNFEKGAESFLKFLKVKGARYAYFEPTLSDEKKTQTLKDFEEKKINVIVLHYSYTEGITIKRAQQMHILEPLLLFKDYCQLLGRVSRFGTHAGLPEQMQKVEYHHWYCTFHPSLFSYFSNIGTVLPELVSSRVAYFGELIKNWIKFDKYKQEFFTRNSFSLNETATPDCLIMSEYKLLIELTDMIEQKFTERRTIELKNLDCCPEDEEKCEKEKCSSYYSKKKVSCNKKSNRKRKN
jgi:superfamily II DNA/RNA helicase